MKEGIEFYRCVLCHRPVSRWDIAKHRGCASCGHRKIAPSNLTLFEQIVQVIKHPAVWKWHVQADK